VPIRRFLAALLSLMSSLSLADVAIPETPPGHALSAWLDAFNSGDRARLEAFTKTFEPERSADSYLRWRADTGAYDLLEIYATDKRNVFFRVKSQTNGVEEVGRLALSATEPMSVTKLGAWPIPPGAKVEVLALDATSRSRVVERVAGEFDSSYVVPELGKKMSAVLRKSNARGEYRRLIYGDDLADRLTDDLRGISHDKHIEVRFSYSAGPPEPPEKQSETQARQLAAMNCGFEQAEHLRPNVGYLKLDMFADTAVCASTASAAMNFLADSDALILDLRDNHGGGGGMVEFVASYLFAGRRHLDDMFSRTENATKETWTTPEVPGKKFIGKPVFILTSKGTFSAAEYFSNVLRNLKRATLVGETTGGGAHTVEMRRIDDHFLVRVPNGGPITKTDWEGTGVEPDVKVPAAEALDTALKLAVKRSP
jgi:hypothetical protein